MTDTSEPDPPTPTSSSVLVFVDDTVTSSGCRTIMAVSKVVEGNTGAHAPLVFAAAFAVTVVLPVAVESPARLRPRPTFWIGKGQAAIGVMEMLSDVRVKVLVLTHACDAERAAESWKVP